MGFQLFVLQLRNPEVHLFLPHNYSIPDLYNESLAKCFTSAHVYGTLFP
jgi:hypothetical protein